MNYYEVMYILDPSLSDEKLEELINSITAELAEKGEVLAIDRLGKKQLAHPIKNAMDGQYVVVYFSTEPAEIERLRSRYSLNASVLRAMILRRREEEIRKIKEKLGTKPEVKGESPAELSPVREDFEESEEEALGDEEAGEPAEEASVDDDPAALDEEAEKAQ